jgi:hypothetical protein
VSNLHCVVANDTNCNKYVKFSFYLYVLLQSYRAHLIIIKRTKDFILEQFCEVGGLAINHPQGGLNHIQLQVRDDIINMQNSYNVLATCRNLVYKYVIILGHFFSPKKPFVGVSLFSFLFFSFLF